jgi:hypothetical protein
VKRTGGDSRNRTAPLLLQWYCSRDLWHPSRTITCERPTEENTARKRMDRESRGGHQKKKTAVDPKRHRQKRNSSSEGLEVTDCEGSKGRLAHAIQRC